MLLIAIFAESDRKLQKIVSEFCSVCKRGKLKVNIDKSKVMVFEGRKTKVID